MRGYFKKLTALLVSMVLALNMAGTHVYSEESETTNVDDFNEREVSDADILDETVGDRVDELEEDTKDTIDSEHNEGKLIITGFDCLIDNLIVVDEKVSIDELGLPEWLSVYISDELMDIDVKWVCDDDYENSEQTSYTFNPVWDMDVYEMVSDLEGSVPTIEVQIKPVMMSADAIEETEVITDENSFDFSNGAIQKLDAGFINSLTDEQKKKINLVIPETIKGVEVTSIDSHAFDKGWHSEISNCIFNKIDISEAIGLTTIGSYAFSTMTLNDGATLTLPSSLTTINAYAFFDCNFKDSLVLPESLKSIGDSAFRMSNATESFTGELVIPESVTKIDKVAFSGQKGITSLKFEGEMVTDLPTSVFRNLGIKGVYEVPAFIKSIGENALNFAEGGTIYLPKIDKADEANYIVSKSFNSSSIVVCDKTNYDSFSSKIANNLSYEMTVNFVTDDGASFEPITRLYNQPYNFEKQSDGQWVKTNYTFPKVQGNKWGLAQNAVTPVSESSLVSQENLYSIPEYEKPTITYSDGINAVYDGQPLRLSVKATHPLAKKLSEAKDGDIVFYYTWTWGTINSTPAALKGFDEDEYVFHDVREPKSAIACCVKIQMCVLNGTKATVIDTYTHDFPVLLMQAESNVTPVISSDTVLIKDGFPEIKLSEGDTKGVITWDKNQELKEGSHEYTWTFTPNKNEKGNYNYKTVSGSVRLYAFGDVVYTLAINSSNNGDIELDKPYGVVPNDDLTITFKPNSGYKLSSALLDKQDILDQVSNNKYIIREMKTNHTLDAVFTSMEIEDVKDIISNLPDIDTSGEVSEEDKNTVLDTWLHYATVAENSSEDISQEDKQKLYNAVSKLDNVETAVNGDAIIDNNETKSALLENLDPTDIQTIRDINDASVKVELKVESIKLAEDITNLIKNTIGDAVIGSNFDAKVIKTIVKGSNQIDKEVNELKKPILIMFNVPNDLPAIPNGYEREYSIVRVHESNGKKVVDILSDKDYSDHTITVESDKFSTYSIIYKDVKKQEVIQGGGSGLSTKFYTVMFETLGGNRVAAITNIKKGNKITQPSNPKREGYTFLGWYTDPKFTIPFDFSKDTIKNDMTLYAGWTKNEEIQKYDVLFDTLGGNRIPDLTIEEGQKVSLSTKPTKAGYTFTGWYFDKDCTQPCNLDIFTVNSYTVLYAGWQKVNEGTFQNDVNEPIDNILNDDISNEEHSESEKEIVQVKLTDTSDYSTTWILEVPLGDKLDQKDMPEKDGYIFKGYFIDEKCTQPWNADEPIQQDLSLYAGWDKIEDSNDIKNNEQDNDNIDKSDEVIANDSNSMSIYMLVLVIAIVIGGAIFIKLKKNKQ